MQSVVPLEFRALSYHFYALYAICQRENWGKGQEKSWSIFHVNKKHCLFCDYVTYVTYMTTVDAFVSDHV